MNKHRDEIDIEIDDKKFSTHDDDQEASSLLLLAGRDPAEFDLDRDRGPRRRAPSPRQGHRQPEAGDEVHYPSKDSLHGRRRAVHDP